jgi:hypothetical protein
LYDGEHLQRVVKGVRVAAIDETAKKWRKGYHVKQSRVMRYESSGYQGHTDQKTERKTTRMQSQLASPILRDYERAESEVGELT